MKKTKKDTKKKKEEKREQIMSTLLVSCDRVANEPKKIEI